jgi:hypothetical protein
MSEYDGRVNDRKVPMNPDRFAALVDAYGALPSRWPAGERAAAEAFAAANAASNAALADASGLDRTLDRLPTEDIPSGLRARILAAYDEAVMRRAGGPFGSIPAALGRLRDAIWPGAPLWQPASAFALSLAIGLAMGLLVPSAVSAHDADPSANLLVVTPAVFDLDHGN